MTGVLDEWQHSEEDPDSGSSWSWYSDLSILAEMDSFVAGNWEIKLFIKPKNNYMIEASSCLASLVSFDNAWDAQQGSTLSPTAAPEQLININ